METLEFTHFGAAGWRVTDGRTTVLLDPYLSRIRFQGRRYGPHDATPGEDDPRPVIPMSSPPVVDAEFVDRTVPKTDYVLLSHAHFNHAMDTPHIAKRTGAVVIGSESVANLCANHGVPDERIHAVRGGEDYAYDDIGVRVVPSLHSALSCKLYKDFGTIPQQDEPLALDDYVEGGTFAYELRIGGRVLLLFGSMNFIEREVEGLRPDAVFVASAPPRLQIRDYTARLMAALGRPPLVIATHWDDQGLPFGEPQDAMLAHTGRFVEEVKAVAPDASVVIPPHFRPFRLEPDGRVAGIETH